jgi:hypothetical protein
MDIEKVEIFERKCESESIIVCQRSFNIETGDFSVVKWLKLKDRGLRVFF